MMSKLTVQLKYVFKELEGVNVAEASPRALQKELADFFVALQPRGVLTCLGVRKTLSSVDSELPPEKDQLLL